MDASSGGGLLERVAGGLVAGATAQLVARGWYDPRLPERYVDGARPLTGAPIVLERAVAKPAPAQQYVEIPMDDGPRELTMANVEQVLDDLVRPALNADGGDISLLRIDDGDVYVKLVGSCSSCPSSVMTMRMGVERLLQEEFPQMNELIQVDSMF